MRLSPRTAGFLAVLAVANLAASPTNGTAVLAAYENNVPLRNYTFHMSVAMAMRHFPWLHFHMDGEGVYARGDRYAVHFDGGPPFVSQKMHDIDLSILDPSMWPGRFRYVSTGVQDGATVFSLEDAGNSGIKSATVALSPIDGAHWVDATYNDGTHIHMVITADNELGYQLPSQIQATVDYPHMPVAADATLSDYATH